MPAGRPRHESHEHHDHSTSIEKDQYSESSEVSTETHAPPDAEASALPSEPHEMLSTLTPPSETLPVSPSPMPSAHALPEPPPAAQPKMPTIDEAFFTLCRAMEGRLTEDIPALTHCQEIQAWYVNGPDNYRVAWQHAIQLMEGVLGHPLGTGLK